MSILHDSYSTDFSIVLSSSLIAVPLLSAAAIIITSVSPVAPERILMWGGGGGGTRPAQRPGLFYISCPLTCWLYKYTISRFGKRFCDGQYSCVSFLVAVLLLKVLPCPAICKSWGACPPPLCPMESVVCLTMFFK